MQSSTAIAIRALIMLIVLISVPLYAIFGKNLPEVIKGLMEGRGLVLAPADGGSKTANTTAPLVASNSLGISTPYRAGQNGAAIDTANGASTLGSNLTASAAAAAPGSFPNGSQFPSGNFGRGEISRSDLPRNPSNASQIATPPMGNSQLMGQPPMNSMGGASGLASDGRTAISPGAGVQPTVFQSPADARGINGPGANGQFHSDLAQTTPYSSAPPQSLSAGSTSGAGSMSSGSTAAGMPATNMAPANSTAARSVNDERFRKVESRLRELGATYYMLESWGAENNQYRFVCKMSLDGNSGMNRVFQKIDDDPWKAMTTVVSQVEQWRSQSPQQ